MLMAYCFFYRVVCRFLFEQTGQGLSFGLSKMIDSFPQRTLPHSGWFVWPRGNAVSSHSPPKSRSLSTVPFSPLSFDPIEAGTDPLGAAGDVDGGERWVPRARTIF